MISGLRQKLIPTMVGSSLLAILASSGMANSALGLRPERISEQPTPDCRAVLESSVRFRSLLASMLANTEQRESNINRRNLLDHAPDIANDALASIADQRRRLETLLSQLKALHCSPNDQSSNHSD